MSIPVAVPLQQAQHGPIMVLHFSIIALLLIQSQIVKLSRRLELVADSPLDPSASLLIAYPCEAL